MVNSLSECVSNHANVVSGIPSNLNVLIDAKQAANIAGTSAKFIRDRCADGTIRATKIGRVWRINRDAFLQQFGLIEG